MACYNGSNNQYYNFPPFMNDGRNFTDLRPEAIINENIKSKQNINTNWKYRRYLQENSNKIIEVNQLSISILLYYDYFQYFLYFV